MKIRFIIAACLGLTVGLSLHVSGFQQPDQPALPNYDKRDDVQSPVPEANEEQAAVQIKARVPGTKVERDKLLGVPRLISAPRGFLTGPNGKGRAVSATAVEAFSANDPHRAIKAFVNEHSALFGHDASELDAATVTRDYVTSHNGLRTVVWQQTSDNIPVFEGILIGHVTQNGELVSISSRFVPNPRRAASGGTPNRNALIARPAISAAQALVLAARNLGAEVEVNSISSVQGPEGPEKHQKFRSQRLRGEAEAQLRWLPLSRDSMRLCWRVELTTRSLSELYSVLVDAETGEVLVRRCLTSYISPATYNVFTNDSPSPFSPGWPSPNTGQPPLTSRVAVTLSALNITASTNGWINDGDSETRGNNVDAHTDKDDNDVPDLPRPQGGTNRVFNPPLDLTNSSPQSYSDAAVVNLFYWNNFMHDKLYELGFTEAAGNFQNNNFGRGGSGNDAVQADAQDGLDLTDPFEILFHRNNANFSTPPDGSPGRMQMYVFDGPTPDRDGDLDAEIMIHEYTHGLSNRLVGGGVGISALQSGGMGEGWSDFYALSLLSQPGDDVHANYAAGGYASYQLYGLSQNYYFGIRRYPYSTEMSKNPLTFKDIDPTQADPHAGIPVSPIWAGLSQFFADEVHFQGEVWCVTLWEARAALIDKLGYAGNTLMLQLVTDGMKLAPPNPTFLEARNAIILADQIKTGGDNYSELWIAFAKRGMGFSAVAPASTTTIGVAEAFDLPSDVEIGVQDGIMEVAITPASDSALFAGQNQPIFIRVSDGGVITNATISATINGTNLVFRNDGVSPDATPINNVYSALFGVPTNQSSVTLTAIISAPGKDTSTNVATYLIVALPNNDNFANAIKAPSGGATYVSNNKLATTEINEPAHAGIVTASASLWWTYSPTTNGPVLVDTAGSAFNSIVAVYTNASLASLGAVASADDIGTRKQAFVVFDAKVGTTYRIAVASSSPYSTGTLFLNIAPGGLPDTNAPVLTVTSPLSGLMTATNRVTVTGTAIDPNPAPSGIKDISIRVNPGGAVETIDGRLTSLVTSSNWSRIVGLNQGLNILEVTVTDVAGNRSPPVTLQVTYRPLDPVNDLFANAIPLTNSGIGSINSVNATREFGEPLHAGIAGGKSVWWSYQAAVDGALALSTSNSTFDTVLGLYTGVVVSNLTTIAYNDDSVNGSFSALTAAIRSNQTYHIAVDGFDAASGGVYLGYTFTPATVYSLTVSNTSGGHVTPSSSDVVSNDAVILTATPDPFFEFNNWTGSFASSVNPLSVVVNSNINLTAHFQPQTFTDDFETGDLSKLGWTSAGNVPWFVQSNIVLSGSYAARSGAIGNSQTSALLFTTNFGGGAASFYFKVSSEPNWDFLKFYVDGNLVQQWSGNLDWQQYPFTLTAGTHTLEWRYTKDANNSIGMDAAFLDNVDLPIGVPVGPGSAAHLVLSPQLDGSFIVDLTGQTNQTYVTQVSSDLISWQPISTNIAVGGEAHIPVSNSGGTRYYRAVVPAP